MVTIKKWLCLSAIALSLLPFRVQAGAPAFMYDGFGNPISSTLTGGSYYLNTNATLSEVATGAAGAAGPALLKVVAGEDGGGLIRALLTDNTGKLQITSTSASVGLTGSAVPTSANYAGFLDGSGNLKGAKVNGSQALTVDGSAVTQPVSAISLPLPTGAATSALQTTANTTLSAISAQLPAALGQTTMSGSLPVTLASNQSALPATADTKLLSQNIISSANLNMNVNGAGTVGIQITGTWSGNINFFASTDGTNFFQIFCNKPNGSITGNTSANGNWFCPTAGYQTIQLNSTSWVSGTAVASMVASTGSNFVYPMNEVAGNVVVQANQGGAWNITNVTGTVSLPTGAATSALQTTGNTALTTINTTLGSPFQAGGSIGNTAFGISGTLPAFAAIPTFKIDQTTPGTTNLVSIGTNGTVQTKAPLNSTGSGSAAGATVSTVITLTAPANAVKAYLMNLDTSTANIRWAVNRTATATLGQQLQPGRDVEIETSHDISLVSESGTQNYDVQWISQ